MSTPIDSGRSGCSKLAPPALVLSFLSATSCVVAMVADAVVVGLLDGFFFAGAEEVVFGLI